MAMSRVTTLLISFTSKIEEALILVPRMGVTEKLKAVQFWNVVSEKLQDIVNKNAADINAVALKMEDSDAHEICLEMSHLSDAMNPLNNSADFIGAPPTSAIYSEYSTQFTNADLQDSHLKQGFPTELIPSNIDPIGPHVEASQLPNIHHINQEMDISQNKTGDRYQNDLTIPSAYNDDLTNSQSEHAVNYQEDSALYPPKQQDQPIVKKECSEMDSPENDVNLLKQALMKEDSKFSSSDYKESNSRTVVESEDSLSTGDLEPNVNLDELDEDDSECIDGLVNSNSLRSLEDTPDRLYDKNKKNTNVEPTYDCTTCSKQYSNLSALKQHTITHKKSFSCSECPSVFATNTKLVVHMRKHTGEKPYVCHQCSTCFSTQGNLKRHMMGHEGIKPWKCSECDSSFTEKKSLTIHMRRHTGERPYKCKMCGKDFTQAGVLESHMAMHLGIKKHLCEKCGKAFRQKSQLRVHKLRHENIKRFKCDTCSMLFLTKADLERHGKTHSGEKPYVCDLCNRKFTRQQSLNEHLNRHYGIKPYTCEHCNKKFVEMSSFYKHLKFHNKNSKMDNQEKSEITNHELEIPKTENQEFRPKISDSENVIPLLKTKTSESLMSSIEEGTQYITVVLNSEGHPEVQGNSHNQPILCDSENLESGSAANSFGHVLSTMNMVQNSSILTEGYLS